MQLNLTWKDQPEAQTGPVVTAHVCSLCLPSGLRGAAVQWVLPTADSAPGHPVLPAPHPMNRNESKLERLSCEQRSGDLHTPAVLPIPTRPGIPSWLTANGVSWEFCADFCRFSHWIKVSGRVPTPLCCVVGLREPTGPVREREAVPWQARGR